MSPGARALEWEAPKAWASRGGNELRTGEHTSGGRP